MRVVSGLVALLLLALLPVGGCVKKGADTGEKKATYTLTKKAYTHLLKVREHMEKKQYAEAFEELDEMAERKYLNPYERASMWAMRAMVHGATLALDKIPECLEEALKLDAMPDEERKQMEYGLAEAYFVNDKFAKSADTFAKWLTEAKNPDPSVYYMTASSYAQAKQFDKALPYAKKAVELMKKNDESWLTLLVSIHYELKQNEEVAELLKRMIKEFPKKQYWLQLSQTYQVLNNTPKALAVLEVAYSNSVLDEEQDFLVLARIYIQQGVPVKAAALIEKHMAEGQIEKQPKNLELLATAWLMANNRERAEITLKEAAGAASSGELYMQLAQFHVERHEWEKASKAVHNALEQKLEDEGAAHLLLGIVSYNQKHMDAALSALNEAKKHEKSAKAAKEWIALVRNERAPGSGDGDGDNSQPDEEAPAAATGGAPASASAPRAANATK